MPEATASMPPLVPHACGLRAATLHPQKGPLLPPFTPCLEQLLHCALSRACQVHLFQFMNRAH